MTGVCLLGQIVNNCVTDNAKLPLSAAQGKVLMDLYNVLNTKSQRNTDKIGIFSFERTANVSDFNEMIELQGYRILCGLINNIAYVSIDIRWIRLQFKCAENDYVYCRSIFGSHAKRDWNRIA